MQPSDSHSSPQAGPSGQPASQAPAEPGKGQKGRSRPLSRQEGGDHYKGAAIQPAEFSERNGLSFLEGSVVKRMYRWRRPGGKGAEDLRKAIHEIEIILDLEAHKPC